MTDLGKTKYQRSSPAPPPATTRQSKVASWCRRVFLLPRARSLIALSLVLCIADTQAAGADAHRASALAYERYVEDATRIFIERVRGGAAPIDHARSPRDGEVIARPGREDGIIVVPGGLVHHWVGATFIGGVTLDNALKVSYAYDDYHLFYQSVIASRLLDRDGNTYRALLRIQGKCWRAERRLSR